MSAGMKRSFERWMTFLESHSPTRKGTFMQFNSLKKIEVECRSCGAVFVFSIEEQELFQARGFAHLPKTCPGCRAKQKKRPLRTDWYVTCADCADRRRPFLSFRESIRLSTAEGASFVGEHLHLNPVAFAFYRRANASCDVPCISPKAKR